MDAAINERKSLRLRSSSDFGGTCNHLWQIEQLVSFCDGSTL